MASYKDYKTVSAAQKAGSLYFVGKDGKKKLAVTKEQLDAWKKRNKGKYKGSALTAWANAKGKDVGGSSARDSSPRPRLRPGSELAGDGYGVMTKAEKDEVDRANRAITNKMSDAEIIATARRALEDSDISDTKKERIKNLMKEMQDARPSDKSVPGRALAIALKNTFTGEGPTNPTGVINQKKADKKITKDSSKNPDKYKSGNSKGGMQMKQGRYNKGGMSDYRKSGMFYGGMTKKR
jgi:hypothetical protein